MNSLVFGAKRAILLLAGVLLVGCAAPPSATNMAATAPATLVPAANAGGLKTTGKTISVAVAGSVDAYNTSFKGAIEKSLSDAGLFTIVGPSDATYKLNVTVIELRFPFSIASKTAQLEAAWSLTKSDGNSIVHRKVYNSEFTGGAFDSFNGATRVVMAAEGATKKNIEAALDDISKLNF
ncbi:MAG: hypothetical protein JO002_13955 [Burkholderiaceae bacterium]|nr:hypothetical protein [Burkholderiaceae bacterium]